MNHSLFQGLGTARLSTLRKMALACALAAAAGFAQADNYTLSGTFARDDNLGLWAITMPASGTFSVRSLGYAGGVDTDGVTQPAGGFDTMAFLFNAAGVLVAQSDDGVGVATDPVTGLASDAAFSLTLAAGTYTLALTQYDNVPVGALPAGFSRDGAGNFTPSISVGCAAPAFCDSSGAARSGAWVLTLSGPTAVTPVPEPAAWALMLAGCAGLVAWRRRSA